MRNFTDFEIFVNLGYHIAEHFLLMVLIKKTAIVGFLIVIIHYCRS